MLSSRDALQVRAALGEFDRALDTVKGAPDSALKVVSLAAPLVTAEHVLEGAFLPSGVVWHDPAYDHQYAGFGETHRVAASGPARFDALARAQSAIGAVVRGGVDVPDSLDVRFFGGAAFLPGAASAAPWASFGDADFRLPRFSYARSSSRAYLHFAFRGAEDRRESTRQLASLWSHLLTAERPSRPSEPIRAASVHMTPIAEWVPYIERIQASLRAGEFHKLVAHRRTVVELGRNTSDLDVLTRLRAEMATSLRFGFRRGNATFLGATPETLFRLQGGRLETEALAGTLRSAGTDAPRLEAQSNRLKASSKDLHEHQLVVDQIASCLSPLCHTLDFAASPGIKKVRNILHLNTPIDGVAKDGIGWASFLDALHPTPAVGGLPKLNAAEWLAAHESTERGWYAAPVGWFTLGGSAHFAVALRCGLLAYPYAYLFSGAGIVPDSSPIDEYRETSLKLMPMLTALSVETATLRSTLLPDALGMK